MGLILDQLRRLKPGEEITFDMKDLLMDDELRTYQHNGATFREPDVVLKSIVGSSWGWGYQEHIETRKVTFWREPDSGRRTYVSPDQRKGRRYLV